MNKLLFGVLIVLIFVFIVFLPYYNSSSLKENFQSITRIYPDPIMEEHEKFIQLNSNDYSLINELIDTLSDEVSTNFNFTGLDTLTLIRQKILNDMMTYTDIKFKQLIDNPDIQCETTSKPADCAIVVSLIQFLNHEYSIPIPSLSLANHDDVANYRSVLNIDLGNIFKPSIYNEMLFSETKQEIDSLLNTLIINRFLSSYHYPYDENTKKKKIKRASQQIIETINNKINPISQAQIACVLYGPNTCPQVPHTTSNVDTIQDNEGDNVIESNLDDNVTRKFKCQTQLTNKGTNLCVNKNNNKYKTSHCEIMNGYGKLMCDNTLHSSGSDCIYEPLSQRCLNPNLDNLPNGAISVDNNEKLDNAEQCHLVYSNDIEEMEKQCENNTNYNCSFKRTIDINNKEQGICYAKNEDSRPDNFCLSFSNTNLIDKELEDLGCKRINRNINGNTINYVIPLDEDMNSLSCQLFDSSKKKYNSAGTQSNKSDNDIAYIHSPLNQKQLCNGLIENNGNKKCQYLEYNKYIPSNHNSKYSKVGMCIPNQISLNIKPDLIDSENKCNNGLIWSSVNNKCINPDAKCQHIKYKNLCNYHDSCLWQAGTLQSDESQDYEAGYCRDLTPSLDRIEDLLDNIHERNLKSSVEVNAIEEKLTKLMPTIKRVMASKKNN